MENTNNTAPTITKETKNKIRVEFDRTSFWKRQKIKYLSKSFIGGVFWKIARFVLLLGISYVILFPFFAKISSSFMSAGDFVDATVKLIPKYPTLDTYKAIFKYNGYFQALLNTVLLSVFCGVCQTFTCAFIGYGFAKFKFRGSNILFGIVILTMIVPHRTLQYSMFTRFKFFDILGIFGFLGGDVFEGLKILPFSSVNLLNTYWPLAFLSLAGLAFKNGLFIFLFRQFFRGVPDELEESAYLDGYGIVKTFLKIIIPLSIPMMITVFLFSFSWQWTDNFYTTLFFPSVSTQLMPSIVSVPKALEGASESAMYTSAVNNACALLIIAPLIVIYLFCQRFLIQGIERSGIVG